MGLGIPSLEIKITLESNPLKSIMLVGGLGVQLSGSQWPVSRITRSSLCLLIPNNMLGEMSVFCLNAVQVVVAGAAVSQGCPFSGMYSKGGRLTSRGF